MVSRERRNRKVPMPTTTKSIMVLGLALVGTRSAPASAFKGITGRGRPYPLHSLAHGGKQKPRGIAIIPTHPPATFGADGRTAMRMSSIGHDDPDSNLDSIGGAAKKKDGFDWKDVLPPAPEDQLVMSGDVVALFVYSFLDHILNDAYAEAVQAGDAGTAAAIDPTLAAEVGAAAQLPVWFDADHFTQTVLPSLGYTPYAPAISTAGTSAIVLTTAWLVAGYFTGAFLFRNTLECNTKKAVWVAGKTWILATALTVGVALASDAFGGWCDCIHNPSLGGLTKADADFIFGSLSVLAMWRYILSSILGYGGSDD